MKRSDLLGIKYLKSKYFRGGEKDCLFTRNLWLKTLKRELKIWDYKETKHPLLIKLKHEMYFKTPRFGSKIFHYSSSTRKKIMWIGAIGNKSEFLFRSQPYDLVVSDMYPSLNSFLQLIFTPNLSLYPIYNSYTNIYNGIINCNEDHLQKGLNKLKDIFNHIKPDLIVLNDDALPIHRGIVLVARELGIPTVEIQHGIYVGKYVTTGREVDYLFVFGKHFKDFYIKNNIKNSEQVMVLGYPYHIEKCYNDPNKTKNLVIYLGQNYEEYNKDLITIKVETVKTIQKICNKLNFDFVYRPHPSDNLKLLKSKLKNINFTPIGETLQKSFEKGDIFISFDSTTLVEATLNSKVAIQLKNYDFPTDNFERIGACSKSVETCKELEEYLKKIKNGKLSSFFRPVKESYMEIPFPNPETRFLELIKKII